MFKLLSLPLLQNHREKPHQTHTHISIIYIHTHTYISVSLSCLVMEERESTVSGSLGNSDTDSPPAPLSNMAAVNTSLGVSTTTTTTTMVMMTETNTNTNTDTTTKATTATTTTPVSSGDLLGKKKRGRPRKYDADGNLRVSYTAAQPPSGFTLSPPDFSSSKRGRGRPPGSGNWQLLASLGEFFFVFFLGKYHAAGCTCCLVAEKKV